VVRPVMAVVFEAGFQKKVWNAGTAIRFKIRSPLPDLLPIRVGEIGNGVFEIALRVRTFHGGRESPLAPPPRRRYRLSSTGEGTGGTPNYGRSARIYAERSRTASAAHPIRNAISFP